MAKLLCSMTRGIKDDGSPSDYIYFPMPAYVKAMDPDQRAEWMRVNNVVPQIKGGAYSMFEMFQPFAVSPAGSTFTAVTASGSKAALTPDTLFTLPANVFPFVGKRLWCHYVGVETNVVTTPGTYTFALNWGGAAGTALQTSGAIAPSAVVNTNTLWYADFYIVCRAFGALTTSLTLNTHGVIWSPSWLVPTTQAIYGVNFAPPNTGTPGTALADVASLNGTIAQALTLSVNPSVSTGSIALVDGFVISMN